VDENKMAFNKSIQNMRNIIKQFKRIANEKDVNKYLMSLKVSRERGRVERRRG
jgi:hypothetical protein